MVRADANHHGRADAGRRGHRQREERLTDGDVDAGVDRAGRFRPEALHLVVLALERRDHRQHGYGVVHDGQAVGLHALDLQQPLLDMHRVVANRPVQQRHDGDREQGEGAVNLERNPDHADQGQAGLRQRLNGQNQRSGCRRLEVDRVHQSCGADLIAIGDRQALGMPEQLTAKVGDDALLQLRVHVTDEHVERGADDGDERVRRRRSASAAGAGATRVRRTGGRRPATAPDRSRCR